MLHGLACSRAQEGKKHIVILYVTRSTLAIDGSRQCYNNAIYIIDYIIYYYYKYYIIYIIYISIKSN